MKNRKVIRSKIGRYLITLGLKKNMEFSVHTESAMAARLYARRLGWIIRGQVSWRDPLIYDFRVTGKVK